MLGNVLHSGECKLQLWAPNFQTGRFSLRSGQWGAQQADNCWRIGKASAP